MVTLLLLLFLSVKLQSVFTHPIMSLIRAMREVARTKNYRVMLESDRRDEFRDLHEGFNAIGSCVRKSYTYLIYNDRIRNPFYVDRVWFYSRHLDEAVMQAAADQFLRWNRAGGQVVAGLSRRRAAERDMFLSA